MNMESSKFWVDLQWHGDEDENLAQPPIGFTSYEEDIEIITPEQEAAAKEAAEGVKSRAELEAELKALQEQVNASAAPPSAQLQQELAEARRQQQGGLSVEQLQAVLALQGQQPQQPRETDAEFAERIKEHIFDNPVAVLDEYIAKKLTPEVKRLATNNMFHSQKYLELDPEKAQFYKKYKAEVDQVAQSMPSEIRLYDPQVYQKAYQQVMTMHIDDVVNAKVAEAIAAQGNGSTKPSASTPRGHSEIPSMPPPIGSGQKKKVVISDIERTRAAQRGVSPQVLAQWKVRHPGQEFI